MKKMNEKIFQEFKSDTIDKKKEKEPNTIL